MDKRGQVYVLAAIIMTVIIYGMVSITNKAVQESVASDFERISRNYATETAKLVNSIGANGNIQGAFRNFTVLFASYAKAQSPKFELISMFDFNNELYIGNFLKSHIIVRCDQPECNNLPPIDGCYMPVKAKIGFEGLVVPTDIDLQDVSGRCEQKIPHSAPIDRVTVTIEDVAYQFELRKGQPEIVVVGWESSSKQRKVFTKGNFITATPDKTTISDFCSAVGASDPAQCSMLPTGRFCNTDCSTNCHIITSEDECGANSAQCAWEPYTKACLMHYEAEE